MSREGLALREEGERKVLDNNLKWRSDIAYIVEQFIKRGKPFTCADVRQAAVNCKLAEPTHPNAWGAVLNTFARKKRIVRTGKIVMSPFETRHGSYLPEWEPVR